MKNESKRGRPKGLSRCECSVVGYLTPVALVNQLSALSESGAIGHWWAVEHEPDEEVRKPHWHIRLTPPPSRSVDWVAVCSTVSEQLPDEDKPRRLVLSARSVNDASMDALLYARHASRYLAAKGLVKSTVDIPKERFYTDDSEWLSQLWAESEEFVPEPRKLSRENILSILDETPDISQRELLRLVLLNGFTQGDYNLFSRYLREVRRESWLSNPPPNSQKPFPEQSMLDLE